MAVASIVVNRIEAKIEEAPKGEKRENLSVAVSTNSRVDKVEVKESKAGDYVVVSWGIDTEYSPKLGSILVEGKLILKGELDSLVKKSARGYELTLSEAKAVHEAILRIPLVVSINMAREINLPMPINFPKVEIKQQQPEGQKAKSS